MKKIVVAIDSYKGSLTSEEACACCADAIREMLPRVEVIEIPVSDGGEGFAAILSKAFQTMPFAIRVKGPMGNIVEATYYYDSEKETAIMEIAQSSGLTLVPEPERNILKASSYGCGEMMLHAINIGAKKIILGLGGSAINDGGMGLLSALGYKFFDNNNILLSGCGEELQKIIKIDASNVNNKVKKTAITLCCDVKNKLLGEDGATKIFAQQKGASINDINILEDGMKNYLKILESYSNKDINNLISGGAAGGVASGIYATFNTEILSGIDYIYNRCDLNELFNNADIIITGEGCMNSQTKNGKVPDYILKIGQKYKIPVIGINGQCEDVESLIKYGYTYVTSINNCINDYKNIDNKILVKENLKLETQQIIRLITLI